MARMTRRKVFRCQMLVNLSDTNLTLQVHSAVSLLSQGSISNPSASVPSWQLNDEMSGNTGRQLNRRTGCSSHLASDCFCLSAGESEARLLLPHFTHHAPVSTPNLKREQTERMKLYTFPLSRSPFTKW